MQIQSQTNSGNSRPTTQRHTVPGPLVQELAAAASRHGFGPDAAQALWEAVVLGDGGMAQFGHSEFGGRGQWMRGGMLMIGDMFNSALKTRVNALCEDVARLYMAHPECHIDRQATAGAGGTEWWPEGMHSPSSSGAQNGIRYAYFPAQRRLAIERGGAVELYDTGDHLIGSVAQQQGAKDSLTFASQMGTVELGALRRLDGVGAPARPAGVTPTEAGKAAPKSVPVVNTADRARHDILETIEKLAGLRERGVLTEAEFTAKKIELLGRL